MRASEAPGSLRDERLSAPFLADDHVQETIGQGRVASGRELQVQVCALRRARAARIDDDQTPAAFGLFLEVLHQWRHGVGRVAPEHHDHFGARNVRDGKRQTAVHAERLLVGHCGRGHAKAPVIIDVFGAQDHAREFAEHVSLFVGQATTTENADRVPPIAPLEFLQRRGHEVHRFFPRRWFERVVLSAAQPGAGQTIRHAE